VLSVRKKDSLTFEDAATRFCIGIANLIRWSKDIEPKAYPLKMYKVNLEDLAEDVKRHPNAYQHEWAEWFDVCKTPFIKLSRRLM